MIKNDDVCNNYGLFSPIYGTTTDFCKYRLDIKHLKIVQKMEGNVHVYFDMNLFSEEIVAFLDKNMNHEIIQL